MPTVLIDGPYRFYFFSDEGNEPAHIHVKMQDRTAKFWLTPVSLAANRGFRAHELHQLELLVQRHRDLFERAWHEYFDEC